VHRGLALLFSLLLIAPHARAQAIRMPPECGSAEEFTRELERLLGDQLAEAQPLSLVIFPRGASGGYTLRLQLRDETRELYDADCNALFRSAVVIAAAAVRPELAEVPEPAAAEPPRIAPPNTAPSRPRASRDAEKRPESVPAQPTRVSDAAPWRAGIHAGAGAVVGLLPGIAPMLELGGTAAHSPWGISAGLRYLPRVRTEDEERGVAIWALGGQVAISFEASDWLRFSAGVAVYRLEGEGLSVAQSLTDSAWAVSPGIETAFIAFHRFDLRVELGLQGYASIVRPRFEISGFGEIYRAPPFGGAAVARVAFRL